MKAYDKQMEKRRESACKEQGANKDPGKFAWIEGQQPRKLTRSNTVAGKMRTLGSAL